MGNVTSAIDENKNLISSISQPLAVIGLDKIGQKMAGKLLSPAVWALNYAANGKKPDKMDVGISGMGLLGGAAGPAAIGTGVVKALVDDDMDTRLKAARSDENPEFRQYIQPCFNYAMAPPRINAMTIASLGGTAWQHANGLWVYIQDANGHMVPNFKPNRSVQTYRPIWPLQSMGGGKFRYTGRG